MTTKTETCANCGHDRDWHRDYYENDTECYSEIEDEDNEICPCKKFVPQVKVPKKLVENLSKKFDEFQNQSQDNSTGDASATTGDSKSTQKVVPDTLRGQTLTHCYIKIRPCGCVTGIIADDLDITAETISEWKKEGNQVAYCPIDVARNRLTECKHKTPPTKPFKDDETLNRSKVIKLK